MRIFFQIICPLLAICLVAGKVSHWLYTRNRPASPVSDIPVPRQELCVDLANKLADDIKRNINRTIKIAEAGEATALESSLIILSALVQCICLIENELNISSSPVNNLLETARKYAKKRNKN